MYLGRYMLSEKVHESLFIFVMLIILLLRPLDQRHRGGRELYIVYYLLVFHFKIISFTVRTNSFKQIHVIISCASSPTATIPFWIQPWSLRTWVRRYTGWAFCSREILQFIDNPSVKTSVSSNPPVYEFC